MQSRAGTYQLLQRVGFSMEKEKKKINIKCTSGNEGRKKEMGNISTTAHTRVV